jgi:hypothetical protein
MVRRRSVTARSGIVATVIGVLAIMSLAGASVVSPSALSGASAATAIRSSGASAATATRSSLASVSEGDTKCVPWPKPTSLGLQCTGTYSGNTAWNPWTQTNISEQPVVTVSQAKDLTDQDITVSWSGFTPTIGSNYYEPNPTTDTNFFYQVPIFECNGTTPDITDGYLQQCYMDPVGTPATSAKTGPPNGILENTLDTAAPPTSIPTCGGGQYSTNSPLYQYLTILKKNPCPPSSFQNGGNPATWTGQADFHVEAPTPRSKGGFFNCSPTQPCSLVVDPNWGGAPGDCSSHPPGNSYPYPFGSTSKGPPWGEFIGNFGSTGKSGYAEPYSIVNGSPDPASLQPANTTDNPQDFSCWTADRIVIPLSFAPTPTDCSSTTPEFYAVGSPMMQTQMLQWQAGWCTGHAPVTLNYTSNSESVARGDFLAGSQVGGSSIDMALVTLPASASQQQGSNRQFTYAPLANSGAGIAYDIDDGVTGTQINRMVLDPQLLAKLFTQSYTLAYGCTTPAEHTQASLSCDPAVWGTGKNAFSLFDDPEFLSLNRQCQPYGKPANYTCSNPSDGTDQSTDDFPANISGSASILDGAFLPTVLEPDNDMTYDLTGWIAANTDAAAFLNGTPDPSGMEVNTNYKGVLSYPAQALSALDQGYTKLPGCSIASPCPSGVSGSQDVTMQATWNPQQDLDTIALDLLTAQPTAAAPVYDCPAVSVGCTSASELVTTSGMSAELPGALALLSELDLGDIAGYQFPAAELVNGAGDAVGPTQASIEAAVGDMKTNPDGITQYFDFASTDPAAYPLAMVDYAMVPTCGLSHATASAIADFLTKTATTGQTQGEAPGDLAPGYYPLTAKQKAQTLTAAQEVEKQTCKSPPADHTVDGNSSAGDTGGSAGKTPADGHQSPSASPSSIRQAKTAAFGQKSADSGLAGLLLALAIIVGVLLVLGGPTAWVITVTGRWPLVLRSVRVVPARLQTGLGRLAGLVSRRS